MQVVSHNRYMRAGFIVKCTCEMLHGRCVPVQVPEDVTLHASVGWWDHRYLIGVENTPFGMRDACGMLGSGLNHCTAPIIRGYMRAQCV